MEDIPDTHGRHSDQTLRHANPTQSKGAGFFVRNLELVLQKTLASLTGCEDLQVWMSLVSLLKYQLQFRAFF